jgi:hypothetical protein
MHNDSHASDHDESRRRLLMTAAGAGVLGLAGVGGTSLASATPAPSSLVARLDDPDWQMRKRALLEGDSDPKRQIHGFNTGTVCGVRDGEAVRPLFGYDVFSSIRLIPQTDGTTMRLNRELVFYRDLKTGQMLDTWNNVYTGETVRVVDVANDPYNYYLTPEGPQTSRNSVHANPVARAERWFMINENTVGVERDVHLLYPSKLRPEQWPRESPGPMTRVSEFLRYSIRAEDLENDSLTHLPHTGTWARVTPWLPWMLMDQAPGHITYVGMFSTRRDVSGFPPAVVARVRERYPKFLNAPEQWSEPSYSSLENYALTQKPAPRRK